MIGKRYTYADMFAPPSRLGNSFRELGVGSGARVGGLCLKHP